MKKCSASSFFSSQKPPSFLCLCAVLTSYFAPAQRTAAVLLSLDFGIRGEKKISILSCSTKTIDCILNMFKRQHKAKSTVSLSARTYESKNNNTCKQITTRAKNDKSISFYILSGRQPRIKLFCRSDLRHFRRRFGTVQCNCHKFKLTTVLCKWLKWQILADKWVEYLALKWL